MVWGFGGLGERVGHTIRMTICICIPNAICTIFRTQDKLQWLRNRNPTSETRGVYIYPNNPSLKQAKQVPSAIFNSGTTRRWLKSSGGYLTIKNGGLSFCYTFTLWNPGRRLVVRMPRLGRCCLWSIVHPRSLSRLSRTTTPAVRIRRFGVSPLPTSFVFFSLFLLWCSCLLKIGCSRRRIG